MKPIATALANLRHLYGHMVSFRVPDTREAARGLLGPAIETLEREIANDLAAERVWLRNLAVDLVRDADGEGTARDLGSDLDRAIEARAGAGSR